MSSILARRLTALLLPIALISAARAQTVTIDTTQRHQTIDGFGTCLSGTAGQQSWFQQLYYNDLQASMLRIAITPSFKSPYSDYFYNSPWYGNTPALPGPDNNNVRTFTSAADYSRSWGGHSAPIAVMGPDIDTNVMYFNYGADGPKTAGMMAQLGISNKATLGDFKLYASMWSPAPWVKMTSGNTISGQSGSAPLNGTAWPFIWGGNFSGGKVDVSGTPLAQFDDSSLGGSGPTSALTQFARGLAAYLRGFQQTYQVNLYAISIQNELNFETFYNSSFYQTSADYIAALTAARAELDKYPDLKPIKIVGPEDLLGGDAYGMWEYGSGATGTHKNLQYLANIAANPTALAALDFVALHGYANDGVTAAGTTPTQWQWWVNGWTTAPAAGLPATVNGFSALNKKSWMTETSGETSAWLDPATGYPSNGAWSIALKIHQALTVGMESGWLYWQTDDGNPVGTETLTDQTTGAAAPKYVAVKHFFKYIRPNSIRVDANVAGTTALAVSAYVNDADGTLTIVAINESASDVATSVIVPSMPSGLTTFQSYTSSDGHLWQAGMSSVSGNMAMVTVPAYGVVTLFGQGTQPDGGVAADMAGDGGATDGGASNLGPPATTMKKGCGCSTVADPASTRGITILMSLLILLAFAHRKLRV